MSTILKALRRLEDQKAGAAPKPLRDEVVLAPARRAPPSGRLLAWSIGIASILAVAAGVGILGPRFEREVASETPPDVAAPAPADVVTVAAPEPAAPAADAGAWSDDAAPDFEIVRPDPAAAARPLAPPPLPRLADDEPPASPERVAARPAPEAPRRRAERALPAFEEELLEEPPVAPVARKSAPVRVARTQWHPSPERRLAWVEVEGLTALREVREGERVGPYLVREIEPAAVLFGDGSVEVRREVGP
jgi:hypothetical protein